METMNTMEHPAVQAPEGLFALVAGLGIGAAIAGLLVGIFFIIVMWKIFTKGGQPGIAAIIPIWNIIAMLQIAGKPVWWIILLCIPFVNIVIGIMVMIALAQSFGKGVGFAIGMLFLPIIFYPMLAFGSAQHGGEVEAAPAA